MNQSPEVKDGRQPPQDALAKMHDWLSENGKLSEIQIDGVIERIKIFQQFLVQFRDERIRILSQAGLNSKFHVGAIVLHVFYPGQYHTELANDGRELAEIDNQFALLFQNQQIAPNIRFKMVNANLGELAVPDNIGGPESRSFIEEYAERYEEHLRNERLTDVQTFGILPLMTSP